MSRTASKADIANHLASILKDPKWRATIAVSKLLLTEGQVQSYHFLPLISETEPAYP